MNVSPQRQAWVQRARDVSIERVVRERRLNLKRDGRWLIGPCPRCGGDDRFAVSIAKGFFKCRGCDAKGDVIAFVRFLDECDFEAACEKLTGEPPPGTNGKSNGKAHGRITAIVTATFVYENADGSINRRVQRSEYRDANGAPTIKNRRKKSFPQSRPDPDRPGAWLDGVDGVPDVPYRLPQVLEAIASGRPIVITEGEGKADLLWSWGVPATCNPGGAGKWTAKHAAFLAGADGVILGDNDGAGRKHVNKIGASLDGVAAGTHAPPSSAEA
jgi:DNA primase